MPSLGFLLCILVVPAFLYPVAPTWGADDLLPSSGIRDEHFFGRVKELMDQGRHAEALEVLQELTERRPFNPDESFRAGLLAIEVSQAPGLARDARKAFLALAVRVFDTMLDLMPELPRVRLELARAFFLDNEDALAQEQFERVLDNHPPAPVVVNVRRYLAEISRRKRWFSHFGFALAPDNNIGSESDDRVINIFGLPFERNKRELTRSGTGISLWGGVEYRYPLGNRLRLRFGSDLSRQEYSGGAYDRTTLSAHAGPLWLTGNGFWASVRAITIHHRRANRPYRQDWGIDTRLDGWLSPSLAGSLHASRVERRHDTDSKLDGPVTSLSATARRVLTSRLLADLTLGWSEERPERENQRNTSRQIQAKLTSILPGGLTVDGGATRSWTDYQGNWFPFTPGNSRKDSLHRYHVGGHHRRFSWRGVSPKISLIHEARRSNAQLHDYRRTFVEMRLVWSF